MDLGRPENAGLLFRRGQRSGRPTQPARSQRLQGEDRPVLRPGHLNVSCKSSRLKQYLNYL
jgi:hypothetical protein